MEQQINWAEREWQLACSLFVKYANNIQISTPKENREQLYSFTQEMAAGFVKSFKNKGKRSAAKMQGALPKGKDPFSLELNFPPQLSSKGNERSEQIASVTAKKTIISDEDKRRYTGELWAHLFMLFLRDKNSRYITKIQNEDTSIKYYKQKAHSLYGREEEFIAAVDLGTPKSQLKDRFSLNDYMLTEALKRFYKNLTKYKDSVAKKKQEAEKNIREINKWGFYNLVAFIRQSPEVKHSTSGDSRHTLVFDEHNITASIDLFIDAYNNISIDDTAAPYTDQLLKELRRRGRPIDPSKLYYGSMSLQPTETTSSKADGHE